MLGTEARRNRMVTPLTRRILVWPLKKPGPQAKSRATAWPWADSSLVMVSESQLRDTHWEQPFTFHFVRADSLLNWALPALSYSTSGSSGNCKFLLFSGRVRQSGGRAGGASGKGCHRWALKHHELLSSSSNFAVGQAEICPIHHYVSKSSS